MEEFLHDLDVFEQMLDTQIKLMEPKAFKILKLNNNSTDKDIIAKSKALQFLFAFSPADIDAMQLIRTVGYDTLILHGECKQMIGGKDFQSIDEGNFCIDFEAIPTLQSPRLIIGRKTIPSMKEYMCGLLISPDKIADKNTANAFTTAIKNTMNK
jgi:hypothetical protein